MAIKKKKKDEETYIEIWKRKIDKSNQNINKSYIGLSKT
jgi:hypothetical protein